MGILVILDRRPSLIRITGLHGAFSGLSTGAPEPLPVVIGEVHRLGDGTGHSGDKVLASRPLPGSLIFLDWLLRHRRIVPITLRRGHRGLPLPRSKRRSSDGTYPSEKTRGQGPRPCRHICATCVPVCRGRTGHSSNPDHPLCAITNMSKSARERHLGARVCGGRCKSICPSAPMSSVGA